MCNKSLIATWKNRVALSINQDGGESNALKPYIAPNGKKIARPMRRERSIFSPIRRMDETARSIASSDE
jgi:hypothetical protein